MTHTAVPSVSGPFPRPAVLPPLCTSTMSSSDEVDLLQIHKQQQQQPIPSSAPLLPPCEGDDDLWEMVGKALCEDGVLGVQDDESAWFQQSIE